MRELSLNVLDITQNSVKANAQNIEIEIVENTEKHSLMIGIYDDGCGMSQEQINSVQDPFYTTRTTRKVGMGVPLFKMAAEMTGGKLEISSQLGKGTKLNAYFNTDNVDFVPLGDMVSTIKMLVTQNTGIDFIYRHRCDNREFAFDTREIKQILGDVPLETPEVAQWIDGYLKENINSIYGGVQNENS